MAQKPRLSALIALLLAAPLTMPLFAADISVKGPVGPMTVLSLPMGIAPSLGAPGSMTLGVIPSIPARVDAGIPQIPTLALAQAAVIPQAALPTGATAIGAPQAKLSGVQASAVTGLGDKTIAGQLGVQQTEISKAIGNDASGLDGKAGVDTIYFGNKGGRDEGRGGRGDVRGGGYGQQRGSGLGASAKKADTPLIKNDEGVWIMNRAADNYKEIRRMVAKLSPRMGLQESLDVMDGTIADVRTKLLALEAISKNRQISDASTHLEETLTFVDGVLDDGTKRVAVHTHQVYFHPAPAGPLKSESEISEGIRRVDSYLKTSERHFMPGADAEKALGPLDEVVLAFDTRGYQEIKDHLKAKEAEFKKTYGDRFRFAYVDELAPTPKNQQQVRDDYNRLVEKYKGDVEGIQKILEGVMYSRYVGILHELKTLEYYSDRKYAVIQSGRDMFGDDGKYITELDAVVRSPEGQVLLVEAKSARVTIPIADAMQEKVLYKLDIYKKNQAFIEKSLGAPLAVVFSVDPGGRDPQAARMGQLVWKNPRQKELMEYMKAQEPILSAKYGFPVSFIFINSHPNEDPMLFYKKETIVEQPAGGRKHGRNNRR
jgi:hypothetical protein